VEIGMISLKMGEPQLEGDKVADMYFTTFREVAGC
jgi:hypothetical protein